MPPDWRADIVPMCYGVSVLAILLFSAPRLTRAALWQKASPWTRWLALRLHPAIPSERLKAEEMPVGPDHGGRARRMTFDIPERRRYRKPGVLARCPGGAEIVAYFRLRRSCV